MVAGYSYTSKDLDRWNQECKAEMLKTPLLKENPTVRASPVSRQQQMPGTQQSPDQLPPSQQQPDRPPQNTLPFWQHVGGLWKSFLSTMGEMGKSGPEGFLGKPGPTGPAFPRVPRFGGRRMGF